MKQTPKQIEALRLVSEGRFYPVLVEEEDGWYARWRALDSDLGAGVDGWVDEFVRQAAITRLTEDAEEQKHETLHDAWLMALRSHTGRVVWDEAECRAFAAELEVWSGSAESDVLARRSLTFMLEASVDSFTISLPRPVGRAALRSLGQASFVCGILRGLSACGDRLSVTLTLREAEDFVRRGASSLIVAGYSVVGLPERATVVADAELVETKEESLSAAAENLRLEVRVAGERASAEDIRFLLDQGSSLVFFREHWIEVDRGILKEALRALEKGAGRDANMLSFVFGVGHIGALEVGELKSHGWIRGLVDRLRARGEEVLGSIASTPPGFCGSLRPYQRAGVAWMTFLTEHGFGALLADDMGLGKTVQTIAWLMKVRKSGERHQPVLIVAPLTLLANWKRELSFFAPALRVYVHQGHERHYASGFKRAAEAADVTLTSYTLLVKDYVQFSEVSWETLVLDEAQAVKNEETRAARAVRALSPRRRLALTGTPIENSVADLWALEDFLNPGFLGDRPSFRKRFERPISMDEESSAAKRLKRALEPFVLRRLKTDAEIAAELGEKRELRKFCVLGAEERRAYESALMDYRASERKPGDAFALLTELKLVCDGFLRDREELVASEGGKLALLIELLETIFAAGESALIFTQYAKVGAALQKILQERFLRRIPFLHGGLSVKAREEEIRRFNRPVPQAFILSLKAGGYGLNLTKATHVIHYDRWWNPAVENQATDRAYRIGQTKDVLVHLLIAEGTVEEHVDELLSRKAALGSLIADGEMFWKAVQLG